MTDSVTAAVESTDYDYFVTEPDGTDLPQSSRIPIISRMVLLLAPEPGHHVLEIGTGSGYTAALLAHLVAPGGAVTSVDVDTRLVDRARRRLHGAGISTVNVHTGDGYHGWADEAPYDRIIGWASPHVIPQDWVAQANPDAVIVTPVKIAPLAVANGLATVTLVDGQPAAVDIAAGGFIEMHPEPITEFGLPIRYVDAAHTVPDAEPWRISAEWLHVDSRQADAVLTRLREDQRDAELPLGAEDDVTEFFAWLYATRPEGLTTAGLSDRFFAVGSTTPDGSALIASDALVTSGNCDATDLLRHWLDQWRAAGKLGWNQLTATLQQGPEGWTVRLAYPNHG